MIFIGARRSAKRRTVAIKKLGGAEITFRGREDYGVMTHFFIQSYRVVAPAQRVHWIIDAGANIGDETLKFRAFHPQAHIVAIEADPDNASLLRANFAADSHVHIEESALWERAGESVHLTRGESPEASRVSSGGIGTSVRTTSFDEIRSRYNIDRFDIVKLDIEGAEQQLLAPDANSWLELVDVLIMEVADHENPGGLQNLLRAMPVEVDCQIVGENIVAVRRGSGLAVESYRYL